MRESTKLNIGFVTFSLVVGVLIYCYSQFMVPAVRVDEMLEVKIEKGESFASVASKLNEMRLIKDRQLFIALGRLTRLDRRLTPGYYQFYGKVRPWNVYRMLKEGLVVGWKITVVEGDTLRIIKSKLDVEGIVTEEEFEALSTDPEFLEKLGINAPSLEGYLFPDTYSISKGATVSDILEMMVRRLEEVYDDEMMLRAEYLGFTRREVLTLASIIEKEAILDSERPIISGVYHNRLRKGMLLQADPTAVYGVKPMSAGVRKSDIERRTDYNTYHIKGLPPGPIASPGLKSIKAALYPAKVPYLFFVANYQGGHTFSITHEEHLQAVEEYRKLKYEAKLAAEEQAEIQTQ